VQVSCSEGLANHTGRESCGSAREGVAEALTAERIGQPSSREKYFKPDADALDNAEGNIGWSDIASAIQSGVVRDPGMCGSSSFGNREVSDLACEKTPQVRIGKTRSRSR
jgi:hypothetical protein